MASQQDQNRPSFLISSILNVSDLDAKKVDNKDVFFTKEGARVMDPYNIQRSLFPALCEVVGQCRSTVMRDVLKQNDEDENGETVLPPKEIDIEIKQQLQQFFHSEIETLFASST